MGRVKKQNPCPIATLQKVIGNSSEEDIPEAYHCTRSTPPLEKLPLRPQTPARRCLSLNDVVDNNTSLTETRQDSSPRIRPCRVSFTNLEIRSYSVVIGDHPCCSQGCSVSLGWDYQQEGCQSLERYEAERQPRRPLSQLRMSAQERESLLLETHSATALRRASRKLHRARSCDARFGGKVHDTFFNTKCGHEDV
mmetsp:Transcript_20600/g.43167  ORF Transcript_20600/g.43167 Transcript_20600/m.43167 type:complete len:195 (-) Transcript_20600:115-699(-)|eukprot:CAMPEP_0172472994 /NCGR_PEP_ID=MMETSP1065-20121228/68632_1 /TAXON_ID=265537 /ORGANISM="Amphiprora paludosa, Strain CCMP125" /LENGTH=194 /DNA_ID=CAMNT_0013231163 /DNA_START=384 /DNA_END=968 /DNA_ORIENTATION=+